MLLAGHRLFRGDWQVVAAQRTQQHNWGKAIRAQVQRGSDLHRINGRTDLCTRCGFGWSMIHLKHVQHAGQNDGVLMLVFTKRNTPLF